MNEPCPSCRRPGCAAQRLPPHADQVTADKVRAFCAAHSPPRRGTAVQIIPSGGPLDGCIAIVIDLEIMTTLPPAPDSLAVSIALPPVDGFEVVMSGTPGRSLRVLLWARLAEMVVVGFAAYMPHGGAHLGDVVI